jgi:hypothetical protein
MINSLFVPFWYLINPSSSFAWDLNKLLEHKTKILPSYFLHQIFFIFVCVSLVWHWYCSISQNWYCRINFRVVLLNYSRRCFFSIVTVQYSIGSVLNWTVLSWRRCDWLSVLYNLNNTAKHLKESDIIRDLASNFFVSILILKNYFLI